MLDVYINASMACTMIKTRSYVLVEIAEKFVDSLICNFNAYIYIYISKLISQVLCGEIVKPSKSWIFWTLKFIVNYCKLECPEDEWFKMTSILMKIHWSAEPSLHIELLSSMAWMSVWDKYWTLQRSTRFTKDIIGPEYILLVYTAWKLPLKNWNSQTVTNKMKGQSPIRKRHHCVQID